MLASNSSASFWIDQKYANLVSPRLDRFKRNGRGYCFRCPVCGDSKRNKTKTRGYLYVTKAQRYRFQCFNCDYSCSFDSFLKFVDPVLYSEYKTERFRETNPHHQDLSKSFDADEIDDTELLEEEPQEDIPSSITPLSSLPSDHEAVMYCRKRLIPEEKFCRIGYVENFCDYIINDLGLTKYTSRPMPRDKRIILELRWKTGELIGIQGRAIENSKAARYITIKINDKYPKIYGLDFLSKDKNLPVFVTEGPIDSLFLPNAIAVCGGDMTIIQSVIESAGISKENIYILLDNEPRSKDTIARMQKAIYLGFNVMFWAFDSSLKDVNDMIKSGITTRELLSSVKKNSKSGMMAKIALSQWKKS